MIFWRLYDEIVSKFRRMDGPRVTVATGELLGRRVETSSGSFYSFQGVPYAKPPLGSLRFKPPVEAESWEGTRDATTEGNRCSQIDINTPNNEYAGSEDCLYLNVYTPTLPAEDDQLPPNRPVIVFVHGGGFSFGSGNSDMYGPDYLVTEDVVVVTVNYRLGPLGFLCLHLKDAPGNVGLRDQILALKWVKNNIGHFGGDSDNVTVAGQSAGAVSISHLTTSPLADELFQKAIISSASCFNDWAIEERPLSRAYSLARSLGCESNDVEEVLAFLNTATAEELIRHTAILYGDEDRLVYVSYFVPVIEKLHQGFEPVIAKHPRELIGEGSFRKIPLLIGYNSMEIARYLNRTTSEDGFRQDFQHLTPREFGLEFNSSTSIELWKKIKQFYFGDKHIGAESIKEIVDLLSDIIFSVGISRHVSMISNDGDSSIYYYRFGYYGSSHVNASLLKSLGLFGAAHQDELPYIFKVSLFNPPAEMNIADARVKERFVSFWTNFAKFGNPTPSESGLITSSWQPVTKNNRYYMNINNDITLETNPDKERIEFWTDLFAKYAKKDLQSKVEDSPTKLLSARRDSEIPIVVIDNIDAPEENKIVEENDAIAEENDEPVQENVIVEESVANDSQVNTAKNINNGVTDRPSEPENNSWEVLKDADEPVPEPVEITETVKRVVTDEVRSEPIQIKVEGYNGHLKTNGVELQKRSGDIIRANDPPEDDLPKNIGVNKFINFFEKLGTKK